MAASHLTSPHPTSVQPDTAPNPLSPPATDTRRLTIGDYVPSDRWVASHKRRLAAEQRPTPAPYLRLAGRWLHKAGFTIGAKVRIDVTPGRLVIEPIPEFPERPPRLPRRAQKLFF